MCSLHAKMRRSVCWMMLVAVKYVYILLCHGKSSEFRALSPFSLDRFEM